MLIIKHTVVGTLFLALGALSAFAQKLSVVSPNQKIHVSLFSVQNADMGEWYFKAHYSNNGKISEAIPQISLGLSRTDQDFRKVAASHANADEHQKLVAHYTAHAAEHEADAKLHEELANQYAKSEPSLAGEARHYAAHSREAAEALRELAKIHQTLAKEHVAKK